MLLELFYQHISQFSNTEFVVGIPQVNDFSIAIIVLVFDYPEQPFDTVTDIGKAPLLISTVNQLDRRPLYQVKNQLGDGPGTSDSR